MMKTLRKAGSSVFFAYFFKFLSFPLILSDALKHDGSSIPCNAEFETLFHKINHSITT